MFKGFCPDWRLLNRMQKNIAVLGSDEFYRSQDWSVVYLIALFHGQTRHDRSAVDPLSSDQGGKRILAGLQASPVLEKLRQNAGALLVYKILSRVDLETLTLFGADFS